MRRCIECGRPYRGGLTAPALLELALGELAESDLEDEHIRNLTRTRGLLRRAAQRIEAAISTRTSELTKVATQHRPKD